MNFADLPATASPGDRATLLTRNASWHLDGTLCEEYGPVYEQDYVLCFCGEWTPPGNFCTMCRANQNALPAGKHWESS